MCYTYDTCHINYIVVFRFANIVATEQDQQYCIKLVLKRVIGYPDLGYSFVVSLSPIREMLFGVIKYTTALFSPFFLQFTIHHPCILPGLQSVQFIQQNQRSMAVDMLTVLRLFLLMLWTKFYSSKTLHKILCFKSLSHIFNRVVSSCLFFISQQEILTPHFSSLHFGWIIVKERKFFQNACRNPGGG